MKYDEAKKHMYKGKKIRRAEWTGYWHMKDGEIYIVYRFFKGVDFDELKEIRLKETTDMIATLSHTKFDDWELVEE